MTDAQMTTFVSEFRDDFQIPPYYDDAVITRAVQRCAARLLDLKEDAEFETDLIGRGLLQNYTYYALNHRDEEFLQNYGPDVRSWQLSAAAEDTDES